MATSHDNLKVSFRVRKAIHKEVLQQLKSMRFDSSTGSDQTPVRFVKLVAEIIASH